MNAFMIITFLVLVVLSPSTYAVSSSDSSSEDKRPCERDSALDLDTADIRMARALRAANPDMSVAELAQLVPLTDLQLDLVNWMYEDLIQYRDGHADIWAQRYQKRPDLLDKDSPRASVFRPDRPNLDAVRESVRQFELALAQPDPLTLRDFYTLLSVFALPDAPDAAARAHMDLAVENNPMIDCRRLPELGLVFTTRPLGFRRLALQYGLMEQYVGLSSHVKLVHVHGYHMFPSEFFAHDISHAVDVYGRTDKEVTDWSTVHRSYREMFPTTGPNAKLCDLVMFIRTHEEMIRSDADAVYRRATFPDLLRWVKGYGGSYWNHDLVEAIGRVSSFLYGNAVVNAHCRLARSCSLASYTTVSNLLDE